MRGTPEDGKEFVTFVGEGLQKPTKVKAKMIDSDDDLFEVIDTIEPGSLGKADSGLVFRAEEDMIWWPVMNN